jgi:hypothetical protein
MNYILSMRQILFFLIFLTACSTGISQQNQMIERYKGEKLPIGMNVSGFSYWSPHIAFTDVMKTASALISTHRSGPWDNGLIAEIPKDSSGYPLQLPWRTSNREDSFVRFLINSHYKGRYFIYFDGEGRLGGNVRMENGQYFIDLDGRGEHVWIDVLESKEGNHIRNIRILPEGIDPDGEYPLFLPEFVEGLKPFHALRFMDWSNTNGSDQVHWEDRVRPDYYTQSGHRGASFEYAIALANELNADAWVCVPHAASDDYIRQLARLWRDGLKENLKIYLEYSNEVWNWSFSQAHYVLQNAPGAVDAYVVEDLKAIHPGNQDHPEKDAYMMARVFRLWSEEFGNEQSRIVRVATGQTAWTDNTRRILEYLFENTEGCDAFSGTGYFNFTEMDHQRWIKNPQVSMDEYYQAGLKNIQGDLTIWVKETVDFVHDYDIDYLVYEGGQHMQPWMQGEHPYNSSLWQFQLHPLMYELYAENFKLHVEVDTQLFMAFSYISDNNSRWGSWGHLNSLDQLGTNYFETAPKYQALLDANTP